MRVAVNGSTVYAVFDRYITQIENDANGQRYDSQLVVVKSVNGGADNFTALGTNGNGVQVATPIAPLAGPPQTNANTPLTLGQNRTDIATTIAVDPNDANHVVVAFSTAPGANGAGVIQVVVAESMNGGANWDQKFITSDATRSGEPSLAILSDGAIGLLYDNYDPSTNRLSQHLLTTTNDFATTTDTTLATASNSTPVIQGSTYLGDYIELTSLRNTFYGVFSASNADNGTDALITNVSFQRNFTGTPGTSSFHLTNANGNTVAASIDPFFFTDSILTPAVIQADHSGIVRLSLPLDQATTISNAINAGTQTEIQYVNGLSVAQVANTTTPAVGVEGSMYAAVGTSAEVTLLATQFLPPQVANAIQHGFNPQVYASEALGLVFAFQNETGSTAFANAFGPSNPAMPNSTAGDAAFAAAAAGTIFGSASTPNLANAIQGFVANWKGFYTSNGISGVPNPTADQIDLAARGTAWGDAVGVALGNNLGPLNGQVTNFLYDAAQGIAVYSASLASQPTPGPFQGSTPSAPATPAALSEGNVHLIGVAPHLDHAMI